jgi:sugar/nucleoside kinase (ribokinase family)
LPAEKIAGATGAGDAFAAGVLLGLHDEYSVPEMLRLGVCAAASSLLHPSASRGVLPLAQCLELGVEHGFRTIER